ncbi:MAG: MATE family efflux transporter, partial [Arachnia propionica]
MGVGDSLNRQVIRLAVPAFIALIAHPLLLLADTVIVGTLGTVPLAGLSIGSGIMLTVSGLSIFLAYGSTAAVARLVGQGDPRDAAASGVQSVWLALIIGSVSGALVWLTAPWLAMALGADGAVLTQAVTYLRWSAPALPGALVVLSATGVFRGFADAKTPLWLTASATILNIALNAWLVLGLGFDISGAAIATAITELVIGLWAAGLVARLARREGAPVRPSWRLIAANLGVGVPLLVRTIGLRIALLLTTYAAASQGAAALAGHHIVMNLWSLLANALDALAIAAQTIIGTALGAGSIPQVRSATRRMTRWSILTGIALGAAIAGTAPWLAAWLGTDATVTGLTLTALLIAAAAQPLSGYV